MNRFRDANGQMRALLAVGVAIVAIISVGATASASHSWGGYHWARQSNPFTLKLNDNLDTAWKPYLQQTSADWSVSEVLDTTIVAGTSNPKTCKPKLGQVEVCNSRYGKNGWLGLAQIWLNSSHIVQGTTKLNDTYFAMQKYDTPAEKNHVMCQEVGHTFGLGHQDESGAAFGTCMDYSMDPGSQRPNTHDYEQLASIYAHLDTTTTVGSTSVSTQADRDQSDKNQSANWGRRVFRGKNGHLEIYERQFQDGSKLVTLVVLADHQ
jgi:hypothetical protein